MKTKYDWWEAFLYVSDRTFLGFIASFCLALGFFLATITGVAFLLTTFGILAGVLALMFVCLVVLIIMVALEIKKRGHRYAKY